MRFPILPLLFLISLSSLSPCQDGLQIPTARNRCPVTKRIDRPFVPPTPYSSRSSNGQFWYGTDKLWTSLPSSGEWIGLPHYTPNDASFRQKLAFWSQGLDARAPQNTELLLSGKRLDSPSLALSTDGPGTPSWTSDDQFIMTGINFPTVGCWEITAHYDEHKLTFVVWVEGR